MFRIQLDLDRGYEYNVREVIEEVSVDFFYL